MNRKIVNEQSLPQPSSPEYLELFLSANCFDDYSWFTPDTPTVPKRTKKGKYVLTGKNVKTGNPIWFYSPEPGVDYGVYVSPKTNQKMKWKCKKIKDTYIEGMVSGDSSYTVNRPSQNLIDNDTYKAIDLTTLNATIFPVKNQDFIYKKIGGTNKKIEQQSNIETMLNGIGYTLTEPDVTSPEWGTKRNLKNLLSGKYYKYYKSFNRGDEDVFVWKTAEQPESEDSTTTGEDGTPQELTAATAKDIMATIKNKEITKKSCRSFIKLLTFLRKTKANISDKELIQLKDNVYQCRKQKIGFMSGIFGIQDEFDSLASDFGYYGLGEYLKDRTLNETKTVVLKSLINESLRKKKTSSITENVIIKNRLQVLQESPKPKTKKEFNRFFDDVINEIHFFNEQNYSPTLIEEGLFDMFQGFFGKSSEGILQHFKERIAEFLLGILGVDKTSWVGSLISVSIGNLNLSDVSQLTNCSFLTKFLAKDIVEAIIKKFQHEDENPNGNFGQFFDVLRNIMVETLESSPLGIKVETKLSEMICPALSKVSTKMEKIGGEMKTNALSNIKKGESVKDKVFSTVKNLTS